MNNLNQKARNIIYTRDLDEIKREIRLQFISFANQAHMQSAFHYAIQILFVRYHTQGTDYIHYKMTRENTKLCMLL